MEEFVLIIKIALVLFFFGSVAYSYIEYEERREPIQRFSSAMDFLDVLKNSALCLRVDGTPNPGLIDVSNIKGWGYENLSRYWAKPYYWEVVIRDTGGGVVYEEGDLARRGLNYTYLANTQDEYSIVYAPVAIRGRDGVNRVGRMEVFAWFS